MWWASSTPLENGSLARADNLDFFLNSLGERAGRHFYWDESLHGEVRSEWSFVSGPALWLLRLGLPLLALLVLLSFEADTGVERLRKIHDTICGKPILFNNLSLSVTCSFGVSILLPSHFYSSDELLERAGQAMMTAKQDGRNRIGFFARSEN